MLNWWLGKSKFKINEITCGVSLLNSKLLLAKSYNNKTFPNSFRTFISLYYLYVRAQLLGKYLDKVTAIQFLQNLIVNYKKN